jgi:hypothetical protein
MSLELGKRLGPDEIPAFIGAGPMGEVDRATDTRLAGSASRRHAPAGAGSRAPSSSRRGGVLARSRKRDKEGRRRSCLYNSRFDSRRAVRPGPAQIGLISTTNSRG